MKTKLQTRVKSTATSTPAFTPVRRRFLHHVQALSDTRGLVSASTDLGRGLSRLLPPLIQPKPTIGQPNDRYEQEADRVADLMMRMPGPRLQRQVEPEEEEEEPIQAKRAGGRASWPSPKREAQIRLPSGNGRPLPPPVRSFFEPRFGHDFSRVRVYADAQAAEAARMVHAHAFTVGRDVVFGARRYQPGTDAGMRLLAHELTHVVQQSHTGQAARGQPAALGKIGTAPPGLYAESGEGEEKKEGKKEEKASEIPIPTSPLFKLDWDTMSKLGLPPFPPPWLLFPPTTTTTMPGEEGEEASAPELPSRVSVADSGQFSFGLSLGFPELSAEDISKTYYMPELEVKKQFRQGEILDQMLTGKVPTGWDAIDKAKLAKAVWGIFSTHIAPDFARSLVSSLSAETEPGGLSYELDLVLLTKFDGGGLSFALHF